MIKLFDNKTLTFQLDVLEFLSSSNLQSERGIDSIIDIALAGIPTELNITQELVKEVLTSLPLDLSDPNKNIFELDIPDD